MNIQNLLHKLDSILEEKTVISEAPLRPGQKKHISFKIKRLDKMRDEIANYENLLYNINRPLPKTVANEVDQLKNKIESEKVKLQQKLDELQQKEIDAQGRPIKMKAFFDGIAKHCRQILKVYKEMNDGDRVFDHFMYRGIKRSGEDAIYGKPFTNRNPKDSSEEYHKWLNDKLTEYGFKATRENSLFVSGSQSHAGNYSSDTYVIFPVDNFDFTVSYKFRDLIIDRRKIAEMNIKVHTDRLSEIKKEFKEKKVEAQKDATDGKNEEFFNKFPSDYVIDDLFRSYSDWEDDVKTIERAVKHELLPKEIIEEIRSWPTKEDLISYFQFSDNNIFKAILSNHEICVKPESYYAVHTRHLKEIKKYLSEIDLSDVDLPERYGKYQKPYRVGSIVKILEGHYKDELGTITDVLKGGEEYEVHINKSNYDNFDRAQIELVSPPVTIPNNEKYVVTNKNSVYYGLTGKVIYNYESGVMVDIEDDITSNGINIYKSEISPAEEHSDLSKEYIRQGDTVEIVDEGSPYYGNEGYIEYVAEGVNEFSVSIGDDGLKSFKRPALKKIETSEIDDPFHKFKFEVGDTLMTSNSPNLIDTWRNKKVTITDRKVTNSGKEIYKIALNSGFSGPKTRNISGDQLIAIVSFTIGSAVKVTSGDNKGNIGKIFREVESSGKYQVINNIENTVIQYYPSELELLPQDEVPEEFSNIPKYYQPVKIIGPSYYDNDDNNGKKGRVVGIDRAGNSVLYDVKIIDTYGNIIGSSLTYPFDSLVFLADDDIQPDETELDYYLPGTIVKLTDSAQFGSSQYIGDLAIVAEKDSNDGSYMVKIVNNMGGPVDSMWYMPDSFKAIPRITLNDKVKIVGETALHDNDYISSIGTVYEIPEQNALGYNKGFLYYVMMPDGSTKSFPLTSLRKVYTTKSSSTEIDPNGPLSVGDIVKHVTSDMTGVVVRLDKTNPSLIGVLFKPAENDLSDFTWIDHTELEKQSPIEMGKLRTGMRIKDKHSGKNGIITYFIPGSGDTYYTQALMDNEAQGLWLFLPNEFDVIYGKSPASSISSRPDLHVYNEGDIVKILGSSYYGNEKYVGQTATVTNMVTLVDGNKGVAVQTTDNKKLIFQMDKVESVEDTIEPDSLDLPTEPDEPETIYKVGDIVTVVSGVYAGKTAEILEIYPSSLAFPLKVKFDDVFIPILLTYKEVKLATSPEKNTDDFKVGDKVKIKGTNTLRNATIVNIEGTAKPYAEVEMSSGNTSFFYLDKLEKVEDIPAAPVKINKGDKVRVISPSAPKHNSIGTAVDIIEDTYITVRFPDTPDITLTYNKSELQKIADYVPRDLQEGDTVEIYDGTSKMHKKQAKVMSISASTFGGPDIVHVKFIENPNMEGMYEANQLKKVK